MYVVNDPRTGELPEKGYRVKIESYLSRGFDIFRMKMDFFLLYTLIFLAVAAIPFIGFFVSAPMIAGFYLTAHYLVTGKKIRFEDMFDGFRHFAGLFLFTLLSALLILLGFLALILPGIYLLTGYVFAPLFIVFDKMDFWDAMEKSRKTIHKEWFSIFIFLIVLGLLNLAGILALGIGVLFTIPVTFCALYVAFDDIVGINKQP